MRRSGGTIDADPVEAALTQLAASVGGSGSYARDLLAEIEVGLRDAETAYVEAGLDPAVAGERAVAEFGDLRVVTRELRAEIAARHTRTLLVVLAIGYPLMLAGWAAVASVLPPRPTPDEVHGWISSSFQWIGLVGLGGAVHVLMSLRRAARRVRSVRRVAAAAAAVATGTGVLTLVMAMLNIAYGAPSGATGFAAFAETAIEWISGAVVLLMLHGSVRCVRSARLLT